LSIGNQQGTHKAERERIVDAVIELVGTRGYAATTTEMIVERAAVSHEEFEAHFADKADCYLQVYESEGHRFMARTAEAFAASEDWRERMRRTAYEIYDYVREDPIRARFVTVEPINAGGRAAAFLDAKLALLVELVHAGRFELEDPDSVPRSAAEAAVGSSWEKMLRRVRNGELGDDGAVRELMYVAVLPYLGEKVAKEELERPRPTIDEGSPRSRKRRGRGNDPRR
jgi:AcrR family transcriptional regulator